MSVLHKHNMRQWVRFNTFQRGSFVKIEISSRWPSSTENFLANEQLPVSLVSSLICHWDRQGARTYILLCVINWTNITPGFHNTVHSLAILHIGSETSQTVPHVLTAYRSVYQCLAHMWDLTRYSGKTAGRATEKLGFDVFFFWGGIFILQIVHNGCAAHSSSYSAGTLRLFLHVKCGTYFRLVSSLRVYGVLPPVFHTCAHSDA
jgi:hypothetical protein